MKFKSILVFLMKLGGHTCTRDEKTFHYMTMEATDHQPLHKLLGLQIAMELSFSLHPSELSLSIPINLFSSASFSTSYLVL